MLDPVETVSFLRGVPLFRDLADEDLVALADSFREYPLKSGEVLFREGDEGREMFLVRRGAVIISKAMTDRARQILRRAIEGDFYGEAALFNHQPWAATVQAEVDSTLLILDRDHLQDLITLHPRTAATVLKALVRELSARLSSAPGADEVTRWGVEAPPFDLGSSPSEVITGAKVERTRVYLSERSTGLGKLSSRASPASAEAVDFALTGPEILVSPSAVVLNVWAFLPQDRVEVWRRARDEEGDSTSMKSEGPAMVERGEVLEIALDIRGLEIPEPRSAIPWTGKIGKTTFLVRVPAGLVPGRKEGSASVYLHGIRLVRLLFVVEIVSELHPDKPGRRGLLKREVPGFRPWSAFASYASRDRREVLKRVQGIEKVGVDVFMDVKSLRSGEHYQARLLEQIESRDVFYLFWSHAARMSSWVEKEWRFALERRGIDFIDPVPLVNPSRVPPPRELADELHFNDWVQAYLASGVSGPRWWQFWRR